MRIGIDARVLQTGLKNRGIGVYTYNLIENLLSLNTNHEFVFFVFKNKPIPSLISKFELIKLNSYKRLNFFFQQFNTFRRNIDIFHTPLSLGPSREIILPYIQFCPVIGTIYDLILYHLKDEWSKYFSATKDYRFQIRALKKTKKIITISHYVKNDIVNTFSFPPKKIVVIYPGVSSIFSPIKDKNKAIRIKKKYDIKKKFILSVGDDYKKNIPTIFKVVSHFPELDLVIVGEEIKDQKLKLQNRVIFTKEVTQEELVGLYNLAELLLFPSIAEGFGLPPVEAFACGCPVVVSNVCSLPEVVGEGGLLFSPYDVNGMVKGIKKILGDNNFRKELISKGFKQAKRFSWQECAQKTLKVYEEIS
jgi:glycosyltransferase involved in cell wall biosynthesis